MRRKPKDNSDLFALRCSQCDRQLERTPSGYWACPLGHGRLISDVSGCEMPEHHLTGIDQKDGLTNLFD